MAFKDIHKLKKIVEVEKEHIIVDHLVVGKDVYAVHLYLELKEKYGEKNVRLLSEDKVSANDLYFKGPSKIRGQKNIEKIKELYPNIEFNEMASSAIFYKDLAWKSFGGRSKPEAFKYDEEFYTKARIDIDETALFSWITREEKFYTDLNESSYHVKVKSIDYKDSKFFVECINGTEFESSKLYFAKSPSMFLKLFLNSSLSKLTNSFIQFAEKTRSVSVLNLKYVFDKPLSDILETMFIPLSYTHEWGHYIGEFRAEDKKSTAHFLHFIDEDHTSEEDVSRIIRGLKKSFEKIFENFSKNNFSEYIFLEDENACLNIDDQMYFSSVLERDIFNSSLFFIGENAPVERAGCDTESFDDSREGLSHTARALAAHKNVVKNLNFVS